MENYVVAVIADAAESPGIYKRKYDSKELETFPTLLSSLRKNSKKLFRLPRTAALFLIDSLADIRLEQGTIPKHVKVLATLNFFAHGSYQAAIGEDSLLGLSQPTTSRCINITSEAIVEELARASIQFPTIPEEIQKTKREFFDLYGMPHVLGAVDGTHIAICEPPLNHPTAPGSLFYNRKGFYSINCQMIVNGHGRIISVNPNFPGSTHDAAIWSMSQIKRKLERDYVNGANTQWLLGDKGYPLQPWIMTPIIRPQGVAENTYNRCHANARNVVEMCYGRLKNKFRCLHRHRTLHYTPPTVAKIIIACCVLHNMFIDVLSGFFFFFIFVPKHAIGRLTISSFDGLVLLTCMFCQTAMQTAMITVMWTVMMTMMRC
ncbi:putative nuclease HARBI1 [Pectinophora gossypiella]|uniref:putative nuclease HARBI1 n=1 Tax=Pectinophora gossypiella TaxID=13191 RepID=UPI00214E3987|nr:putative nuclease HARBI1 [Pectinophora gossypiella]